jgi:hypothetical protein
MLAVCREFQILFNETREKALKAIAFSKTLKKDLENGVLKDGISPECNAVIVAALEELTVSGVLCLQPCSCAINSFWADSHSRWSSKTACQ